MTDQERAGSGRATTTHEGDDTQIEHEASANQVQDEPFPASHEDDGDAAGRRNPGSDARHQARQEKDRQAGSPADQ